MSKIQITIYPRVKDWVITLDTYYKLGKCHANIKLQVTQDSSVDVKKSFKNVAKAAEWVNKVINGEIQLRQEDL